MLFYFAIKTMLEHISSILLSHLALFFPAVHDPDISYRSFFYVLKIPLHVEEFDKVEKMHKIT